MILLPHGTKIGKATVIVDIISKQNPEIRPGILMKPRGITDHDTGNAGRGADAEMHNRYIHNMAGYHPKNTSHVSWHITVDEDFIIQHIPFNEPAYHCGDGWGPNSGNRTTIGVEKCMNVDGDRKQTEENAIALYVFLTKTFGWNDNEVNPHQKWSGKYCPAIILKRDGSFTPFRNRIKLAIEGKESANVSSYLKRGDYGPAVKAMQENLTKAGLKLTVDSSFGPATESALKAYQTTSGLVADGYYGPLTKAKIEEEVKPKPKPVVSPQKKHRLTTGTFPSKAAAEMAAKRLREEFGWLVYLKEE